MANLTTVQQEKLSWAKNEWEQGRFDGVETRDIAIRLRRAGLDKETIQYFKMLAKNTGMSYQNLINLYLRDCAASHRKLNLNWK